MRKFSEGLYAITDREISGLSHVTQVEQLIEGGARLIQLREKSVSPGKFYEEAKEAVRLAHSFSATILIDDRVDLALAVNADGVHLGQTDIPPAAARQLLGPHAIIGYSTHNLDQVSEAADFPINYIALGPIFETKSKQKPDPVVGLEGLVAARQEAKGIPLVAIGGIKLESVSAVLNAGADAIAVISDLMGNPNGIALQTARYVDVIHAHSSK